MSAVKRTPGPGHPLCLNCGKKLRAYAYRAEYPGKNFGGYGDNHFCGLTCGYRWAVMYLERHRDDLAAPLHAAMVKVVASRAAGRP